MLEITRGANIISISVEIRFFIVITRKISKFYGIIQC